MRNAFALLALVLLTVTGCAVHSPMRMTSKVEVTRPGSMTYPAHSEKIFITKQDLPAGVQFDMLGVIDVGRVWYGGDAMAWKPMADKARELGADAIIKARIWRQPEGWAWAAPQGSGTAVKLQNKSQVDFSKLSGEWY